MLPVDEIFGNTMQGEGSAMGYPSVFIRLGGCNLTCSGFGCQITSPLDKETIIKGCDSIHAVNVKHFKHTWSYYDNYIDLVKNIENCFGENTKYSEKKDIIITGGEPILHYKDDVMIKMIEYFISRGHRVWIETNGTININFDEYPIYKDINFSMSVKMSNSSEPEHKRWKPDVVNNYLKNTKESYFKFVLTKEQCKINAPEVFDFLKQVPTFGLVYCMPMGETAKEVKENSKTVFEFSAKYGFRYSDRLHIRIYNDLRGV